MEIVATALVLLVLIALGGLVALPALPLLLRFRGRAGRVGRTIALCGASFFLNGASYPFSSSRVREVTVRDDHVRALRRDDRGAGHRDRRRGRLLRRLTVAALLGARRARFRADAAGVRVPAARAGAHAAKKELAELKGYAAQRKPFGFRSDLAYVRKLIEADQWESTSGFIPVTKREDEYLQLVTA